ncbi:MAG: 2Fe-2S iron-sulfur cluster-binding protein [Parvibaculum sp.]|uniref:2Fe-2S iron-sulfur cluster-binding protein n=1 Tax=Parvibaculum sp. TaxID=2024848 RepID=UPI003C70802B
MAKITYIEHNGKEHTVEVADGLTLMEGAMRNSIPGIDADCGGACACATCMVYVPEEWFSKLEPAEPMEETMLDFCDRRDDSSRLSCQLKVSPALDGIRVKMPESQH